MADVTIHIEAYAHQDKKPGVVIGAWEGQVHMNCTLVEGYPSMTASEARAVAAVLNAQADEAERKPI